MEKDKQLELFSYREVLEGLKPEELLEYKAFLLDKYSDIEKEVHLVNEVLEGYGYGDES